VETRNYIHQQHGGGKELNHQQGGAVKLPQHPCEGKELNEQQYGEARSNMKSAVEVTRYNNSTV
jgi:hypothetical protein